MGPARGRRRAGLRKARRVRARCGGGGAAGGGAGVARLKASWINQSILIKASSLCGRRRSGWSSTSAASCTTAPPATGRRRPPSRNAAAVCAAPGTASKAAPPPTAAQRHPPPASTMLRRRRLRGGEGGEAGGAGGVGGAGAGERASLVRLVSLACRVGKVSCLLACRVGIADGPGSRWGGTEPRVYTECAGGPSPSQNDAADTLLAITNHFCLSISRIFISTIAFS